MLSRDFFIPFNYYYNVQRINSGLGPFDLNFNSKSYEQEIPSNLAINDILNNKNVNVNKIKNIIGKGKVNLNKSSLICAIKRNDLDLVKYVLTLRPDIKIDGDVLIQTIKTNNADILKFILYCDKHIKLSENILVNTIKNNNVIMLKIILAMLGKVTSINYAFLIDGKAKDKKLIISPDIKRI